MKSFLFERYAQNSSGQSGAIPAAYVEIIQDESAQISTETTQPLPIAQSTENEYTPDSSFDSLSSSTINNNLTDPTMNSFDPYKTILDPNQEQQNSLLGDLILSSPEVKTDTVELTPNERNSVRTNSSANDSNKNKSEKTKLFTLKRDKPKDSEKRRGSVENGLDVSNYSFLSNDYQFLFYLAIKR